MKNTIKQIFHSGKFVTGFVIFLAILLTIIIYPFVVAKDPLAMNQMRTAWQPFRTLPAPPPNILFATINAG